MTRDQKDFVKTREATVKKLAELNSDYNCSIVSFESLVNEYHDRRVNLQYTYLNNELRIRRLITEKEWSRIMADVMERPEKEKTRKDAVEKNNKSYEKLLVSCKHIMLNEDSFAMAKEAIERHRKVVETFIEEFLDLGYRHMESVRNYHATLADFEPIRMQMSDNHRKYLVSIVVLRSSLVSLSTASEWKGISKELNSMLKNGNGGA